jgi:phosphopantothenoylcysteine decarboxylase/phosphopantothenate--cysteine ligase
MNVEMWLHPATQENVNRLKERGVRFIDPGEGYLACRTVGPGRLAEPDEIVRAALELLAANRPDESQRREDTGSQHTQRDLHDEHVLITAGPTYEAIDPVRGVTNRSSGRMGYAIAEAALARGARVTLVSGPVSIDPPAASNVIRVQSAAEMHNAVMSHLEEATIAVMAAAVADYRPVEAAVQKIKKDGQSLVLELEPTEDILAAVGREGGSRVLIGFAAETEQLVTNARKKLFAKGADLIVANDVSSRDAGFDVSTNRVALVLPDRVEELPLLSKREVADRIFDTALRIKAGKVVASSK